MSETIQLVLVGAVMLAAAVYLLQRWGRPVRSCDACPREEPSSRLVQLGRAGAQRPKPPIRK